MVVFDPHAADFDNIHPIRPHIMQVIADNIDIITFRHDHSAMKVEHFVVFQRHSA